MDLGSIPGHVMWDLWWKKWKWGGFSPNVSISPSILMTSTAPHPLISLPSTLYSLDTDSVVK
jgi:hypothetical protein